MQRTQYNAHTLNNDKKES